MFQEELYFVSFSSLTDEAERQLWRKGLLPAGKYYRKRGSASYIVREVLLVRERERERERERYRERERDRRK